MKKLAIISTHPIQYNAPLFKLLHERSNINIKVFYSWGSQVMYDKYDPGFANNIQWDIPLLDGYDYEWVENIAKDPGTHHFKGIDNPGLIKSIESWNADAVLVYGWNFKSHLKVMRHFKGKIPVYFRGDSTLMDKLRWLKKIFRYSFLKWVYHYVDKVLYVGTNNKKYYTLLGFSENQMIFAPHAVENLRFFSNVNNVFDANNFRDKIGIPINAKVLLFAGKLEPKKNCTILIKSFKELNDANAHLLVVGNGVLIDELKSQANCNENIHFLDFQNQKIMPVIYQMADVYILPSKGPGETWGLSINEAMASGKVILASDACGAAIDLVRNGINGYIFRSNDKNDLKEKINNLMGPGNDLKKMGEASLSIIKDWNYERDCEAIESLFN